ncbi:class I SAM-dependent methyltransferase [Simiduia litorea]
MVFVTEREHLSFRAEKKEYDYHENLAGDVGYLNFLRRLADPLVQRLSAASVGLDIGCGPGPVLQTWLQAQGFKVAIFDKFYARDGAVLQHQYDFVCATEVVEHFRQPGLSLLAMWQLLKPGGYLALMTKRVIDLEAFSRWHYKNDPTHISFFSDESFSWLAAKLNARLEFVGKDVVFLKKPLLHGAE